MYVSSFSVQNLFTITGYKGSNPAGYNGEGDIAGGLDFGSYPTPRTFTFDLERISNKLMTTQL